MLWPSGYETIGLVSATSGAGMTHQGSVDYATAELKKQAAKLGANGVLLRSFGEKNENRGGQTVQGKAIFVPAQ